MEGRNNMTLISTLILVCGAFILGLFLGGLCVYVSAVDALEEGNEKEKK